MLANDLHRLNQSVMKAVEAGVSVELVRSARHHGGNGNWGDLLIPVIVTQQQRLIRLERLIRLAGSMHGFILIAGGPKSTGGRCLLF